MTKKILSFTLILLCYSLMIVPLGAGILLLNIEWGSAIVGGLTIIFFIELVSQIDNRIKHKSILTTRWNIFLVWLVPISLGLLFLKALNHSATWASLLYLWVMLSLYLAIIAAYINRG